MKTSFREIDNKNIFLLPILIILFVFFVYIFVWFKVKSFVINYLDNFYSANVELKYGSVRVSGFPFILNISIKDLKVTVLTGGINSDIIIENILVKNLIFTKKANLSFDGKVYLYSKNSGKYISIDNDNIDIYFNKNGKLENIDGFIYSIMFASNNENVAAVNNATIKMVTSNDHDYVNRTFRFNTDQIKYGDDNESNFEIILSNIIEKNNGNVVAVKNVLDTFSFNDITNNYNISISGDSNANLLLKTSPLNLLFTINNYNSLIKALNDENSQFLLNKEKISQVIQVLQFIPKNDKDTVNVKNYDFSIDLITKKTYINGQDVVNVVKEFLF